MLAQAMEAEVAAFVENHANKVDERGHRMVVRNGQMPQRELVTGIGRVAIKKRVASVDSLIPVLYLKGVSTGDFSKALQAILGERAPGLSANSVVRLKAVWSRSTENGRAAI